MAFIYEIAFYFPPRFQFFLSRDKFIYQDKYFPDSERAKRKKNETYTLYWKSGEHAGAASRYEKCTISDGCALLSPLRAIKRENMQMLSRNGSLQSAD